MAADKPTAKKKPADTISDFDRASADLPDDLRTTLHDREKDVAAARTDTEERATNEGAAQKKAAPPFAAPADTSNTPAPNLLGNWRTALVSAGVVAFISILLAGAFTHDENKSAKPGKKKPAAGKPLQVKQLSTSVKLFTSGQMGEKSFPRASVIATQLKKQQVKVDPKAKDGVSVRLLARDVVEFCQSTDSGTACTLVFAPKLKQAFVYADDLAGARQATKSQLKALRKGE